jgi:hypothetical protein
LKQNEIEAAAIMMRIFLTGLAFNFDANYHELEEITKRALFLEKKKEVDLKLYSTSCVSSETMDVKPR